MWSMDKLIHLEYKTRIMTEMYAIYVFLYRYSTQRRNVIEHEFGSHYVMH